MPDIFKALASISVWILFVAGCANFIITLVTLAIDGVSSEEWEHTAAFLAIATVSILFSVIAMKIRKKMEK